MIFRNSTGRARHKHIDTYTNPVPFINMKSIFYQTVIESVLIWCDSWSLTLKEGLIFEDVWERRVEGNIWT
jgi:hypothetical protein